MQGSPKQLACIGLKDAQEPIIGLVGAFRTGKTIFGGYGFCELMIEQQEERSVFEGDRYAVVGHANVLATYKNVVSRMIKYLELRGYHCKKMGSVYDYIITKGDIKFTIETFSVNNSVSYERLQGGTYRSVFVDEAPLIGNESINEIIGRTTTFEDAKAVLTGNPEGNETHEFYEKYLSNNDEVLHVHFTMLDNPINTPEKIEYFRKIFTDTMFRRKVLGEWVAVEGMCYANQPKFKKRPEKFDFILAGLDYGESDATTVVVVGVKGDDYYIMDQYYHKNGNGKNNTILDYKREIAEFLNDIYTKENKTKMTLYVETSPSSVYNLFTSDREIDVGIKIQKVCKKKENIKSKSAIQERIDATNVLINAEHLFYCKEGLPVVKAFKNAVYKNNERLDNGTSDIDSLDGFEYAIKVEIKYIFKRLGVYAND